MCWRFLVQLPDVILLIYSAQLRCACGTMLFIQIGSTVSGAIVRSCLGPSARATSLGYVSGVTESCWYLTPQTMVVDSPLGGSWLWKSLHLTEYASILTTNWMHTKMETKSNIVIIIIILFSSIQQHFLTTTKMTRREQVPALSVAQCRYGSKYSRMRTARMK